MRRLATFSPMKVVVLLAALCGGSITPVLWFSTCYAQDAAWQHIVAQDKSFEVKIPPDWGIESAVLRWFSARSPSPRGESVGLVALDVFADPQSMANAVNLCARLGCDAGLQVWSPPLAPVDVVRVLYPRVVQGVSEMRILAVWNITLAGFQGNVVWYRYMRQGDRIEGFAQIFTLPGVNTPDLRYWSTVVSVAEGPRQYFRRNLGLYARILQTLHYSPQALASYARAPFEFANQMMEIDRGFGKKWLPALGGQVPFPDPSAPSGVCMISRDDLPPDLRQFHYYVCGPCDIRAVPYGNPAPCPYGKPTSPK